MKTFLKVVFVLVLGAAGTAYHYWGEIHTAMDTAAFTEGENKTLIVARGTGFNRLIGQLKAQGLIENELFFKLYTRYYKLGAGVKAGEYSIAANTTPHQILQKLSSGDVVQHNVTLIEGSNFAQLREQIAARSDVIKLVTAQMSEQDILKALGAKAEKIEGLLLAETYRIERGSTDLALIKRAYVSMQALLEQQWKERDKKLPYKTAYEGLIMASIVEKETGAPVERPVIAGVFVNRLRKGMKLQTDPTVIYGMGERYKGNITRADLRRPSAYNTYVIPALPPTPIATVGPEAVKAAFNPVKTPYFYFVAKGDGSHYFSKSLREHNNAVRKYQLKRRKNYRSSPSS
ncbi:MAG: endolytic transglycosylase MltG [Pseudomonadales bacterium]